MWPLPEIFLTRDNWHQNPPLYRKIFTEIFSYQEVTGNPNVGFDDEDLEGDFDPAKYDEAMQVLNRINLPIWNSALTFYCLNRGCKVYIVEVDCRLYAVYECILAFRKHLTMSITTGKKLKSQYLMMKIGKKMRKVRCEFLLNFLFLTKTTRCRLARFPDDSFSCHRRTYFQRTYF